MASSNDLLDARTKRRCASSPGFIGVTVVQQDDSYNLFIGSGQPLVVGATASRLEVVPGTLQTRCGRRFSSLAVIQRQGITSLITGGEMGG